MSPSADPATCAGLAAAPVKGNAEVGFTGAAVPVRDGFAAPVPVGYTGEVPLVGVYVAEAVAARTAMRETMENCMLICVCVCVWGGGE
jgi:hypothetical protein